MRTASAAGPEPIMSPEFSTTAKSQIWRTRSEEWVTNRMVRPSSWNSLIRAMHLREKASSPTASTSSTTRMSGSTLTATAKPSRTYIPDE